MTTFARELAISDENVLDHDALQSRLLDKVERLMYIHHALRQGAKELDLPGSDRRDAAVEELMYARDPTRAFNRSGDAWGATLSGHGLDAALIALTQLAYLVHDEYADPAAPLLGTNATALRAQTYLSRMHFINSQLLRRGLLEVSREYQSSGVAKIQELRSYEIMIYVFNLLVLATLWLTVYRTMAKQLLAEGKRSEDVLSLIPPSVIERCPKLHVFYAMNGSNGWLQDGISDFGGGGV